MYVGVGGGGGLGFATEESTIIHVAIRILRLPCRP